MTGLTIDVIAPGRARWISSDGPPREVTVTASVPLSDRGDAWLAAGLPTAMRLGGDLSLEAPVDPILVEGATQIGDTLHGWYRRLAPLALHVRSSPASPSGAGVGCFFSGGGDSFYSVLRNRSRITQLIFVHGFDIDANNVELGAAALASVRRAASALDLPLVEVHTDLRHVTDEHVRWGEENHGAAIAMVAHLLAPHLSHVIVPASYNLADVHPWGSHPELDPLWASSALTFEHHGAEVTRPEKFGYISRYPAAMQHLRVCWENPDNAYNCGRCEKCLRTMINLRVVGAADRCETLPDTLTPAALRKIRMGVGSQIFARENLAAMDAYGVRDRPLRKALRRAILAGYVYDFARRAKAVISTR